VPTPTGFDTTFKTLRALFKPYARRFSVAVDESGRYFLASKTAKTSSGAAVWFGGAEIRKNYVTLHFIPVYANPALRKELSPSLLKRMQGKGCFNFTDIDPAHVKELKSLLKKGAAGFVKRFP
jgi:hypothetical protein